MKTPLLPVLLGLSIAWLAVPGIRAAAIPVENPSFETPVLADRTAVWTSIPGWTPSPDLLVAILNPWDDIFSGTTDPRSGLPDGKQLVLLNSVGTLTQTLSATVQANTDYTLRVSVGDNRDYVVGPYAVELRAGGQLLGSASPPTFDDTWIVATVRYRALAGDPRVGQPLQIVLRKETTVLGNQVDFDNVQLDASPISDVPVSNGLVAHWKFDETTGTIARDVTGLHDGQLMPNGSAFVAGGIAGGALQLDRANNGMVVVPHIPEVATTDFTAVIWTKLPPGDTTASTFPITHHETWYENGWLLLLGTSPGWGAVGKASFMMQNGNVSLSSTTTINDGQWHQIVATYAKNGAMTLYVDGAPAEATRPSVAVTDRQPPLLIGGLHGIEVTGRPQGYYTGWIDDVQLYSRVLNGAQVDLLFRNPGKNLADLDQPIVITPNGGEFVGSVDVSLTTSQPGTTIRYTLDGTDPVATSLPYQAPITLRDTTTLKSRLFVGEFPASEVFSATFTKLPSVAIQPPGGLFTNAVQVTVVNNLGMGTLFYTTDGSDPVSTSPPYTTPLTLTNAVTLKARVLLNGFPVSETAIASFARVYTADDGIPDAWQEQYFGPGYMTDPRAAANADPDGDQWNNELEYNAGTNPIDDQSVPIRTGIRAIPVVSWNSVPGLTYRILRKVDAGAPTWDVVVEAFKAAETTSQYIDVNAPWTAVYLVQTVP